MSPKQVRSLTLLFCMRRAGSECARQLGCRLARCTGTTTMNAGVSKFPTAARGYTVEWYAVHEHRSIDADATMCV
eukprot:6491407-Amphidinium_carterae.2